MSIPLLNTFCRLAATSANKVLRPSHYSLTTATGSKRSSADSDLLLCHVRLWRTSRLIFWRRSGCEHCEIKFALHNTHVTPHPPLSRWMRCKYCLSLYPVNTLTLFTPAMHFQRACRQCVHESARLPRVICSHAGEYEVAESGKTTDLCFAPCRTHLPRTARATDSCTRRVFFKRGGNEPMHAVRWLASPRQGEKPS